MHRGDVAAATRILRGDKSRDAAAGTWNSVEMARASGPKTNSFEIPGNGAWGGTTIWYRRRLYGDKAAEKEAAKAAKIAQKEAAKAAKLAQKEAAKAAKAAAKAAKVAAKAAAKAGKVAAKEAAKAGKVAAKGGPVTIGQCTIGQGCDQRPPAPKTRRSSRSVDAARAQVPMLGQGGGGGGALRRGVRRRVEASRAPPRPVSCEGPPRRRIFLRVRGRRGDVSVSA